MSEEKILILNAVPNPDRNQIRPLAPGAAKVVTSWAEASRTARAYIEKYNLGAGNWPGAEIATFGGEPIARISYNGRVWDLQGVCLYDPGVGSEPSDG